VTLSPREIVGSGLCIGCGGCTTLDPAMQMGWNANGHLEPKTTASMPTGDAFAGICPFSPVAANEDVIASDRFPDAPHGDALIGRYAGAYVGHVDEGEFRIAGSSGGMVSWVATELLRRGLVDGVVHVTPQSRDEGDGRLFGYRISRSVAELHQGAKSRYYPVELSGVLRDIARMPGRYAVVGIPCFIKAINLLRRENPIIAERVTHTIGLFCGHMKSAQMVDSFAVQLGAAPQAVSAIDYRLKNPDRPANWYTAQLTLADGSTRQQDWWHLVDGDWGSGFFMNSACNFCDDVVAETADIAMGDAWVEPYSSDGKGTNVVIARSPLMLELLQTGIAEGRLCLSEVDHAFVSQTQAAGFRQRREGLAYRLSRARLAIQPIKRVEPSTAIPARRKLIYRMRQSIGRGSHRAFRMSRVLHWPGLYIGWGRAALAAYHGFAYSRGRLGRLVDRFIDPSAAGRD
jgi:coenzyme F420-reducing hydrogenase beta subunit